MMKNEMIKKHNLIEFDKKTCLKVQCHNSKDYNKYTKQAGAELCQAQTSLS